MTEHINTLASGIVLHEERIPQVKKNMSTCLGSIPPGLRPEIFARFVGFRTYASLRAALAIGPFNITQVYISAALDFCASRDLGLTEEELRDRLDRLVESLREGAIYIPDNR